MSDHSTVDPRVDPVQPVDIALQRWRETSERRAAEHAERHAVTVARRRTGLQLSGGAIALTAIGFVAWSVTGGGSDAIDASAAPLDAPLTAAAAPAATPAAATQADVTAGPAAEAPPPHAGEDGLAAAEEEELEPTEQGEPVKAEPVKAEPVKAEPARTKASTSASGAALGIVDGSLRSWTLDDAAWIQFDYTGAEITLRWFDAAGAEALSPVICDNRVNINTRRCYVGRNEAAIGVALDGGAAPGAWTVQACADGRCADLSSVQIPLQAD